MHFKAKIFSALVAPIFQPVGVHEAQPVVVRIGGNRTEKLVVAHGNAPSFFAR